MLLISYDISNDKLRTKFSKYLSKFGFRLQYSLFEIKNSETVLQNIETEIKNTYMKACQAFFEKVVIFFAFFRQKRLNFRFFGRNSLRTLRFVKVSPLRVR